MYVHIYAYTLYTIYVYIYNVYKYIIYNILYIIYFIYICAGLWYPSSRVQTRPKPSDF